MMGSSVCTTISSGRSDPATSTVTRERTITIETGEIRIVSRASMGIFKVSADGRVTEVILEKLETSLAGVVLIVEYDGQYKRLWTWLWRYGLSRDVFNSLHLGGDWPDHTRLGRGYTLHGCKPRIPIHENALANKWSGRLLIQNYQKRPLMLFSYLWQDIQRGVMDVLSCRRSRSS